MNILNIPGCFNFLKSVHEFIINRTNDKLSLSNFTILLPSRRSCNELKRIFLENSSNSAIILPNIRAIGDIDYDDLVLKQINKNDLENFSDFSNNTSRIKYKILLIKELLKWAKSSNKNLFKDITIEQASNLALELEKFLNEVNRNGLNLDDLEKIVDDEYSQHWQEVLNFLEIFGKKWNKFIKDNNVISVVDFKSRMIEFNAEYFKKNKPLNPIVIAGVSGSVKSTCEFIKSLIKYDNCYYFFKDLNKNLTEDEWKEIGVFHPQYSFKNLLDNCINCERDRVKNLEFNNCLIVNPIIEKILSFSMLPYNETHKWQSKLNIKKEDFSHISKIECNNSFEELSVISLITKHVHETSNDNVAIITSDEIFANQLAVELKNLNLDVNNAFGNKISRTEVVKFLFLILDVIKNKYETVAFLSLLKHDFTLFGYNKNELNRLTLLLEDKILRGYGNLGCEGILKKVNEFGNLELIDFIKKIMETLDKFKCEKLNFQSVIKLHIELAENIASNSEVVGSNAFWNNSKNGDELLNFFNEVIKESESYGDIKNCDEYSYLLDYLIAENSYSDRYSIHPMVNIISPQEAKLINYDLIILTNLNDGRFPPHISTDPWMSKSMRKAFGLPDRDELIGNFAYDFTQFLCNKKVILTRSLKEDGVPTVKSKYLMRLETFLLCQNHLKLEENNIWKEVFKKRNFAEQNIIIKRPKPKPPLDRRPRELYATKIEKLMNNPYDIYAEKILNLKKKDDFYENKIFAFFGSAVHEALENYIKNYKAAEFAKLYEKLIKYGKESFDKYFTDETSRELFFIRFSNIAEWFIEQDEAVRASGYNVYAERIEKLYMKNIDFTIAAKIDRIEENEFGSINIIDYKTGNTPSTSDVLTAKKPQLIIEAIVLENKKTDKLVYWSIKGKGDEKIQEIDSDICELVNKGRDGIVRLITHFNVFENSYIATAFDLNDQNHYASDYKHLSRVEEWGYL